MPDEPADQPVPATVEVTVALAARGQISGTVTGASGTERPFFGWLELMDALEDMRRAGRDQSLAGAAD
jgi:hypothetical protein